LAAATTAGVVACPAGAREGTSAFSRGAAIAKNASVTTPKKRGLTFSIGYSKNLCIVDGIALAPFDGA
jgi:hypothetical protein